MAREITYRIEAEVVEELNSAHICEECGERGVVIDTRERDYGLKRRRECPACKTRWTTVEVLLKDYPLAARKRMNYVRKKRTG